MQADTKRIRILALFLGVIFLGAQFHFCTDLTSVVAAQSPLIAIVPVTNRLEIASLAISPSSAVSRATSPRAPPAL